MDFGRSFSFITEDEEWLKKLAIAALLVLTGIGSIAVIGWTIEIIRRVANDEAEQLPGWEGIGGFFGAGFKLMVVSLVWEIPLLLVAGCFGGIGYFLMTGDMMDDPTTLSIVLYSCAGLFALVYLLIFGLLAGPLWALMGDTEPWTKLFNPAPAFKALKGNIGGFLIAMIAGGFIAGLLGAVGTIACGIGSFFGMAFGYAIMGHLLGQAYKVSKENTDLVETE